MSDRITEALDRIEAREREPSAIEGDNALSFLQAVYRDSDLPLPVRMRAAIECLPFEAPKLSATAILSQPDFGVRLERAIARSGVKLIEAKALPQQE